jgi:hypothetical protein
VYESGRFDNSTASKPTTLNSTGTFAYSGPSFDRAFPNYKMNGTITVVNQPLATTFNSTTTATNLLHRQQEDKQLVIIISIQ